MAFWSGSSGYMGPGSTVAPVLQRIKFNLVSSLQGRPYATRVIFIWSHQAASIGQGVGLRVGFGLAGRRAAAHHDDHAAHDARRERDQQARANTEPQSVDRRGDQP